MVIQCCPVRLHSNKLANFDIIILLNRDCASEVNCSYAKV